MFRVEPAEDAGASSALETGSHMTPQTLPTLHRLLERQQVPNWKRTATSKYFKTFFVCV